MTPVHGMDAKEIKIFNHVQNILALAAYVEDNELGINPVSYLRRPDKQAKERRDAAGMEWVLPQSVNEPSLAELFRVYWKSNRADIDATDLTSAGACQRLLEKVRGVRSEVPDTQT